jgi:hypothetical protein
MLIYIIIFYYLGRILPTIVNLCPARDTPDLITLERPNGTIVELGYNVNKIFKEERSIAHLQEIYTTLYVSTNKFPFLRHVLTIYIAK